MHFTLIEPQDPRWTSFLAGTAHDVYHKPGYVRLLARERQMQPYACIGGSDTAGFFLPLLISRIPEKLGLETDLRDAQSPDGYPTPLFAGDPASLPETLRSLMSFLRHERIITAFIRTHPLLGIAPHDFEEIGDVVERGHTVAILLDAPYDEILLRMRQGHRYEIRRALERGYRTSIDQWDLFPHFVRFYRQLMDRVDATESYRFSDAYFRDFRKALGDSAHLVVAETRDGAPAAAALFTETGGLIQYHLAAGDPAFESDAVQKVAVDGIIRWGLKHLASTVHLGGGVGARDDSLLHFKAGFGEEKRTYSTIHLAPDPPAAGRAEDAWRAFHGGLAPQSGFFPAYRSLSV
ncbi:MAG: GNAT family N-acetyltransferase [Rhodothermales bacterium]